MTHEDFAHMQPDVDRLAGNDASFKARLWENLRAWDKRLHESNHETDWQLLEAYVARVDCDEDFSSIAHFERANFCAAMYRRLAERDGQPYIRAHAPTTTRLMARFDPRGYRELYGIAREIGARDGWAQWRKEREEAHERP